MPKRGTKCAANVFYRARMDAAEYNDRLSSREGAAEVTGIDRNRIAYTELGTICPYPEEVLIYADAYNAPEIINHFCSRLCPIGKETVDSVNTGTLEATSMKLLASTKCITEIREDLIDIAEDGVIDEKERDRMNEILEQLRKAANDIKALEIVYQKLLKGEGAKHDRL